MPGTTWILVSNAANAKLYANHGPNQGLTLVKETDHPESRLKNSELVTDRPGFLQSSGNGHGARQPATLPKEHAARKFAHSLAQELCQARKTKQLDRIILVAPPAFMGLLNEELDPPTAQLVSDRFEKDYTKSPERQLAQHLESCIYL
jgi:protein required for attachment to host cells